MSTPAASNSTTVPPKSSDYGKPVAGSKSEKRAKQAHQRISNEILELCSIIQDHGLKNGDDQASISFGRLFEIYVRISNKVVGVLLRYICTTRL